MVYITGDCHFNFDKIFKFCEENKTQKDDIIIILGDACVNYYEDSRDLKLKKRLSALPITLFFVYGNHEIRPDDIDTYEIDEFCGSEVFVENKFPSLKFAIDGNVYDFDDRKALVIGGAYSVDKYYRIGNGLLWMDDEQPSDEIFEIARENLEINNNSIDLILTHTCPYSEIPEENKCTDIEEDTIDSSTEKKFQELYETVNFKKWYCGHFHIDKDLEKLSFLHERIIAVSIS